MPNLNISYDELQNEAAALRAARDSLVDQLNDVRSRIQNLLTAGFVTDRASISVNQAYEQFRSGSTGAIAGLDALTAYLTNLAQTLQETDSSLSQQLGE
jgi:uncharacterized protein YukE